jgi:ankyrin repeat protein
MASSFYKISCIDPKKECNIIDPISEKLDFAGINPISGQKFIKDDIDSILKRHSSMCLNKNSSLGKCCDPMETRFTIPDELKKKYEGKKLKPNREFGIIQSIDVCNDSKKCTGAEWITPTQYLMCKIGDNSAETKDNVMRFNTLTSDCYNQNCNPTGPQIGFGDLIKGSGKQTESTVIIDLRLADNLREDNVGAIKSFLDKYKATNQRSGTDYILSDNDSGDSLLIRSIKMKATKCVALLLGEGVDVNTRSLDTGMTTLHYACMYGNSNMISYLINYGARTDVFDFKGRPPLFYAIMFGNLGMVSMLTNQNPAMLNVTDKEGNNPLHIATKYSMHVSDIVKYLIDNGVSSDVKNKAGLTPAQVGTKRSNDIKINEQNLNTERFIEPFETLAKAEETTIPESEILSNLNSAISTLRKANVNENQNMYKGFITPQQNLDGPVNFDKYACYPHASIENKKDCEKEGGKWQLYDNESMATFAKVDYQQPTPDPTADPTTESDLDKYYYTVKVTPVPVKKLQPLDHDSIMNITSTTPSPSPTPTTPIGPVTIEGFYNPEIIKTPEYINNCNMIFYAGVTGCVILFLLIIFLIYKMKLFTA